MPNITNEKINELLQLIDDYSLSGQKERAEKKHNLMKILSPLKATLETYPDGKKDIAEEKRIEKEKSIIHQKQLAQLQVQGSIGGGSSILHIFIELTRKELTPFFYPKTGEKCAQVNYILGKIYKLGLGVDADQDRALACFQEAENNGEPRAYIELALHEENTNKNKENAVKYYNLAIKHQLPQAYNNLAAMYLDKDPTTAISYLTQAITNNPSIAILHKNLSIAYNKASLAESDPTKKIHYLRYAFQSQFKAAEIYCSHRFAAKTNEEKKINDDLITSQLNSALDTYGDILKIKDQSIKEYKNDALYESLQQISNFASLAYTNKLFNIAHQAFEFIAKQEKSLQEFSFDEKENKNINLIMEDAKEYAEKTKAPSRFPQLTNLFKHKKEEEIVMQPVVESDQDMSLN